MIIQNQLLKEKNKMKTILKLFTLFYAMTVLCKADFSDDREFTYQSLEESPYFVLNSDPILLFEIDSLNCYTNNIVDLRRTNEFNDLKKYFLKNSKENLRYLFINRLAQSHWSITGTLNDTNVTNFVEYCFVSLSKENKDSATIFFYDSNFSIKTICLDPDTVLSSIKKNIRTHFSGVFYNLKLFDFAIIDLSDEEEKMLFFVRRFWDFEFNKHDRKYDENLEELYKLLMILHKNKVFTKKFGQERDFR